MAADLDAVLEPGETIAFRTSGRSYRRQWSQFGSAITGLALLLALMAGFNPEYDLPPAEKFWILSAVFAAIACPWALALLLNARKQRWPPDEVVITERRLLYSKGHWTRKFDSIALEKIQGLKRTSDPDSSGITIDSEDQILRLPRFGSEPELATSLADAAGMKPLPEIGGLVDVDLRFLGYSIAASIGYLPALLLIAETGFQFTDERVARLLTGTIPFICASFVAIALGTLIANLLTAMIMRPLVSPEQRQAGLCAGKPDRWDIRLALRWAGLLYGRPLPYLAN